MKEIDFCLVRHFEENLRLHSETGWAEFGYSKDKCSQSLSFFDRWSRGTKTLGTRLLLYRKVFTGVTCDQPL